MQLKLLGVGTFTRNITSKVNNPTIFIIFLVKIFRGEILITFVIKNVVNRCNIAPPVINQSVSNRFCVAAL